MNAIYFGLKRAFQAALRISHPHAEAFDLTPARFDLLYCLRGGPISQREFRPWLGVTAQTISRMLQSLERLGLVLRTRCKYDSRQLRVSLSGLGRAIIRRVFRQILKRRVIQRTFENALAANGRHDNVATFRMMENLEDLLRHVRSGFKDVAGLSYPWHPDN